MLGALTAFLMLCGPAAARDGQGWNWRQTQTPHFLINSQATWLPAGFSMGAERVHSRLRMDLGLLSPWMTKEKINLYIYADHEGFLAGEFAPPKWSNGLAVYDRKAVAMPTMKDPRKMLAVMAHEATREDLLLHRVRSEVWGAAAPMLQETGHDGAQLRQRWTPTLRQLDR